MTVPPTLLTNLSPEHRQLVVRGAEEESVTETEWIERAIVLRAGEQGVTAHGGARREAARHRVRTAGASEHDEAILEGVSGEHRELVSAGAEQESITAREWIEKAVVLKAGRAPAARHEVHERARHVAEAREGSEEVRRESEEVETRRTAAPPPRPRHEEARPERGFSSYHAHVAARAAAAEAMPLEVWMEEAILERAGYRGREAPRPPPPPPAAPPPPPAPPPPAPAPWETVIVGGGRGGLAIGLLLGVLLAIVLILFLSWIRSGGAIALGGGGSSGGAPPGSLAMASATVPVVIPAAYVWAYPGPPASPSRYWGPPGNQPGAPGPAGPPAGQGGAGAAGAAGSAGASGSAGAGAAGTGAAGASAGVGGTGAAGAAGASGGASGPGQQPGLPGSGGGANANANAGSGGGARPEVVVKIIEHDRVYVRAPARRAPARRPEGGDHYGYLYEDSTAQASSQYDRRSEEPPRVWPPDCGCDADADDSRDPR